MRRYSSKLIIVGVAMIFNTFLSVHAQENLIPLPTNVQRSDAVLDLTQGIRIEEHQTDVKNEYALAEQSLTSWRIDCSSASTHSALRLLELRLEEDSDTIIATGAYQLKIDDRGI